MGESVAFDRAAGYYDATRGFTPEGERAMVDLLTGELRGRGRVLEIGVGTGQVALPLHAAGIPLVGMDLARPMMDRLVEKAGGWSPFPLVQGDATRLPFANGGFGAAYLRWVLHLIPDWRAALTESVRVTGRGGVLLILLGSAGQGTTPEGEIHARFAELTGSPFEPAGLRWSDYEHLDEEMTALGATPRAMPTFTDVERDGLEAFLDNLARRRYSWTWRIQDDDRFAEAVDEIRRFAADRFGPLDRVPHEEHEVAWRAYDLPA
jgi:demethylmenaquinone methyltransferase/2-methoxy-6-polyprenyl-1,4-benzoquinol methylase